MASKPGAVEDHAEAGGKTMEESKLAVPLADHTNEATAKETMPTPASIPSIKEAPADEGAPDPDEDDLDDLDGKLIFVLENTHTNRSPDMLDEFNPSVPEPRLRSLKSSAVSEPVPKTEQEPSETGLSDEDFAKQLQAGMAQLLGELDTSPDMQAQFESMMKELGGAAAAGGASATSKDVPSSSKTARPTSSAGDESFQETIKKTMERMQASGASATAAAASTSGEDMLAEMMKAVGGLDGDGTEEDFSKMLLGMMEQLTNKEILYEPMKELHDKFPEWMVKNETKTPAADIARYKEQQTYVKEIVGRFERKGYSDENVGDREYIVERMQKVSLILRPHHQDHQASSNNLQMQAAGSPPPELVGSMEAAQEAFGAPEEGCPTQ